MIFITTQVLHSALPSYFGYSNLVATVPDVKLGPYLVTDSPVNSAACPNSYLVTEG